MNTCTRIHKLGIRKLQLRRVIEEWTVKEEENKQRMFSTRIAALGRLVFIGEN